MNTNGPQASVVVCVDVTQEDIEKGVEGSCEQCPIARALMRAVGGAYVSVDPYGILIRAGGRRLFDMNTPMEMRVFMAAFDNLGAAFVRPFTYDLTLPAWVVGEEAA